MSETCPRSLYIVPLGLILLIPAPLHLIVSDGLEVWSFGFPSFFVLILPWVQIAVIIPTVLFLSMASLIVTGHSTAEEIVRMIVIISTAIHGIFIFIACFLGDSPKLLSSPYNVIVIGVGTTLLGVSAGLLIKGWRKKQPGMVVFSLWFALLPVAWYIAPWMVGIV